MHEPLDTHGLSLEQTLFEWPDEPLPNIAGFDRIDSREQAAALNEWIEPQRVCTIILKYHGPDGLKSVIAGIARACSKHRVHMKRRVRSAAEFMSLPVY